MTARERLWEVAVEQQGFVTTDDARVLGIPAAELAKLKYRGKLVHVALGVYRFAELPATSQDEYTFAVLWTGHPEAALSHDTVLALHDLGDANPTKIHVTLPVGVRTRRRGGELYGLHHEDLGPEQIGWWEGVRAVRPSHAIEQCIRDGLPQQQVAQALVAARKRGLVTALQKRELEKLLRTRSEINLSPSDGIGRHPAETVGDLPETLDARIARLAAEAPPAPVEQLDLI